MFEVLSDRLDSCGTNRAPTTFQTLFVLVKLKCENSASLDISGSVLSLKHGRLNVQRAHQTILLVSTLSGSSFRLSVFRQQLSALIFDSCEETSQNWNSKLFYLFRKKCETVWINYNMVRIAEWNPSCSPLIRNCACICDYMITFDE